MFSDWCLQEEVTKPQESGDDSQTNGEATPVDPPRLPGFTGPKKSAIFHP